MTIKYIKYLKKVKWLNLQGLEILQICEDENNLILYQIKIRMPWSRSSRHRSVEGKLPP
jgi:hypothetical protein